MSASCPGEIEITDTLSVSCGTQATTFNADGTFADVQTTDEFGAPFDWRSEGTWSTQGSTLTLATASPFRLSRSSQALSKSNNNVQRSPSLLSIFLRVPT